MDRFPRLDHLTHAVEEDRDPFADFGRRACARAKISTSLGGRTVFSDRASEKPTINSLQLDLF
jgi:hypothetical protein